MIVCGTIVITPTGQAGQRSTCGSIKLIWWPVCSIYVHASYLPYTTMSTTQTQIAGLHQTESSPTYCISARQRKFPNSVPLSVSYRHLYNVNVINSKYHEEIDFEIGSVIYVPLFDLRLYLVVVEFVVVASVAGVSVLPYTLSRQDAVRR